MKNFVECHSWNPYHFVFFPLYSTKHGLIALQEVDIILACSRRWNCKSIRELAILTSVIHFNNIPRNSCFHPKVFLTRLLDSAGRCYWFESWLLIPICWSAVVIWSCTEWRKYRILGLNGLLHRENLRPLTFGERSES